MCCFFFLASCIYPPWFGRPVEIEACWYLQTFSLSWDRAIVVQLGETSAFFQITLTLLPQPIVITSRLCSTTYVWRSTWEKKTPSWAVWTHHGGWVTPIPLEPNWPQEVLPTADLPRISVEHGSGISVAEAGMPHHINVTWRGFGNFEKGRKGKGRTISDYQWLCLIPWVLYFGATDLNYMI